jgi:hypothetical protein
MSMAVSTRRRRRLIVAVLGRHAGHKLVVLQFRGLQAQHTGRSCSAAQKKTSTTK